MNMLIYDENSIQYHYFEWLHAAKKTGGSEIISLAKQHIMNWNLKKYL